MLEAGRCPCGRSRSRQKRHRREDNDRSSDGRPGPGSAGAAWKCTRTWGKHRDTTAPRSGGWGFPGHRWGCLRPGWNTRCSSRRTVWRGRVRYSQPARADRRRRPRSGSPRPTRRSPQVWWILSPQLLFYPLGRIISTLQTGIFPSDAKPHTTGRGVVRSIGRECCVLLLIENVCQVSAYAWFKLGCGRCVGLDGSGFTGRPDL